MDSIKAKIIERGTCYGMVVSILGFVQSTSSVGDPRAICRHNQDIFDVSIYGVKIIEETEALKGGSDEK